MTTHTPMTEEFDPHEVSKVRCIICTHEWIAVRPLGTQTLECPNCEYNMVFEELGYDNSQTEK